MRKISTHSNGFYGHNSTLSFASTLACLLPGGQINAMDCFHVRLQIIISAKVLMTHITSEPILLCMREYMSLEVPV